MTNYQGETESVHVHTGQESSVHKLKRKEAKRKEWTYINDIVRAINAGNYKKAGALLQDYRDNYVNSNIWIRSQMGVVSKLEESVYTNTPVSATINGKKIIVEPTEEIKIVRPYKRRKNQ